MAQFSFWTIPWLWLDVKKDYQVNVKVFAGFNKKRLKKYKILY